MEQRQRHETKPGQEVFVEGQKIFQQGAQSLGSLCQCTLWVILSKLLAFLML